MRRNLADVYERIGSDLALGSDAPLELYERQVAYYSFEQMNDRRGGWVLEKSCTSARAVPPR